MRKLIKYAQTRLKTELEVIRSSEIANFLPELSLEEKAFIYKYTDDGHFVNETLREHKSKKIPDFAKHLDTILAKLPNFVGITFRGSDLTSSQIVKYQEAFENKAEILELGFLSTSRIKKQADKYRTTVMFEIYSKNGKLIEKLSKFVNEQEVLFKRMTKFRILGIEKMDSYVYITMKEV